MADPKLTIRIGAELGEIRKALNGLSTDLQGFKRKTENTSRQVGAGLEFAKRAALQLGTALGAAFSVRTLAAMSDEAAGLNARLKLATKTTEEFNRAQAGTFDIAQRTRTSLKATAELYARIERSTRELGVNQATVLQLTETINQAAQISGGGAGAEAALFQLSQGLASGQLRGEELNSVLEQTPRLAQAIADGMNLPIGQLRKYAQEGKLSAQEVLRALVNQKDAVAAEFAEMPATISGGFTQIRNAFLNYIGTSQEAGTAAANVAKALKSVAENLPALISAFVRLGSVVAAYVVTFKLLPALYSAVIALSGTLATRQLTLAAAFTAAGTAGQKAMFAVRSAASVALAAFAGWQLGSMLREQFQEVELFGIALAAGLHKIAVRIQHYFETAGTRIQLAFSEAFNWVVDKAIGMNRAITGVLSQLPGAVGKAYARAGVAARGALEGIKADTSGLAAEVAGMDAKLAGSLSAVEQGYSDLADAAVAARQQAAAAAGAGDIGLGGGGGGGGAVSAFRGDLELLKDSIDRALRELDRLYEEGEIGLREYFRRKAELQTQAIDTAIAQARQELAVADTQDAQRKALVEIAKLQRDRAEVGPRVAREQAKAEEELARKLEDVRARLAELTGDSAATQRLAIERERKELLRSFADDPEAQAAIGNLFNLETVRANLGAIRDEVQRTISDLRGTESLVAAQQDAGQLDPTSAEEQLQAVREQSIEQLQRYREQVAALYATSGDPEVLRQLQEIDTELARVSASANKLALQARDAAINSLTTLFTDLASGTKSAGDALRDFVRGFAQSMAQIAAKALATFLVLQLLDAIYPGLGKATAATMGAGVNHRGGMAGTGPTRQVDPLLFMGAPRFHTGGVVGLKSDEVPAILQRGEEVLAKNDPRNVTNGGGRSGGGTGTRVINVIDPSLVQDYMDSPAGEEAILNVIGRNPGRVKQVVG